MRRHLLAALPLAVLVAATSAHGATLTITPDKATYQVGETITLSVFGDSEGGTAGSIAGRILFDAELVGYVGSTQELLTSFGGAVTWTSAPLQGGPGFGDAFRQLIGSPIGVDGPLTATVTLQATAPGTLDYAWQIDGDLDFNLRFFGLLDAPGGSVLIVPEPATGWLVALGVAAMAVTRRRPKSG